MMSIRLRLTVLYSAILALTLALFGVLLYTIQARYTLDTLKSELQQRSDNLARSVLWRYLHPDEPPRGMEPPPPLQLDTLPNEVAFNQVREREIIRVLNADGELIGSPFGLEINALPLSDAGLQALKKQQTWWEIAEWSGERMLIYNQPGVNNGELVFIIQSARPLTERDRSLVGLSRYLIIAGLLTTLAAFGIGWWLAGTTLRPIHAITHTAQAIGAESDFSRRVDYRGPPDEVGELALTFNNMLSRLQEAYQQISQTLKMQRNFVADVSHELRTPLTTIRGNLALLRREPALPAEEQADVLDDLVSESDRLIRLVNDLLVLARADAGQSLALEIIPLQAVIAEAVHQAGKLDPQREIRLTAPELSALGYRDALKQVLLIVLDNALKYTRGPLTVNARPEAEGVVIEIQDSGPGIDSESLVHIFDRFYRGEVKPAIPGFGLGLPIAKALVEGQQGRINLSSDRQAGSLVQIFLKAA